MAGRRCAWSARKPRRLASLRARFLFLETPRNPASALRSQRCERISGSTNGFALPADSNSEPSPAHAAFEEQYREHQAGIARYIASRVRDRAHAQDLAQEVYAKAYRHRDRFDDKRPFAAWIYTIARNACIDHLRRRTRDPVSTIAPGPDGELADLDGFPEPRADDPQVAAERRDLIVAIRKELAQLPPERRAAVEMKIVDGLTYRETAEALGVPLGTVAYWVRESVEAVAERLSHLR